MRTAPAALLLLVLAACGGEKSTTRLEPWQEVAVPRDLQQVINAAGGKPILVEVFADW